MGVKFIHNCTFQHVGEDQMALYREHNAKEAVEYNSRRIKQQGYEHLI